MDLWAIIKDGKGIAALNMNEVRSFAKEKDRVVFVLRSGGQAEQHPDFQHLLETKSALATVQQGSTPAPFVERA